MKTIWQTNLDIFATLLATTGTLAYLFVARDIPVKERNLHESILPESEKENHVTTSTAEVNTR